MWRPAAGGQKREESHWEAPEPVWVKELRLVSAGGGRGRGGGGGHTGWSRPQEAPAGPAVGAVFCCSGRPALWSPVAQGTQFENHECLYPECSNKRLIDVFRHDWPNDLVVGSRVFWSQDPSLSYLKRTRHFLLMGVYLWRYTKTVDHSCFS